MARERRNWTSKEDELLEQAVERGPQSLQNYPSMPNVEQPAAPRKRCNGVRLPLVCLVERTKIVENAIITRFQQLLIKGLGRSLKTTGFVLRFKSMDSNGRESPSMSGLGVAINVRSTKTLLRCVEQQGHNWKSIVADYFPGRTALSARNQYNYMCRRSGVNSQPSTPGSLPSTNSSLHKKRSSEQSGRPSLSHSTQNSSETILESEEDQSDFMDDSSSDDDDEEDWQPNHLPSQSEPAKATDSAGPVGLGPESPPEMESLWPVAVSSGIPQYPSLDQMFPNQAAFTTSQQSPYLQSPFSDDFIAQTQASLSEPPTAFYGLPTTNLAEVPAPTGDSTLDCKTKKSVTITATCSRAEIQRLMQMTAQELQYIDFSVTSSQRNAKSTSQRSRLGDTKHVVITATCPAKELGRLMEMASDTLGSVSFSVCPSVDKGL
ncbi:MAG: hypothetical protein Q9195_008049 [Heterodermia aff. obscurata]